tara:strand:+ start:53 stop:358 length:306 start_codon:yes stop_codon:yes gene_type:complete
MWRDLLDRGRDPYSHFVEKAIEVNTRKGREIGVYRGKTKTGGEIILCPHIVSTGFEKEEIMYGWNPFSFHINHQDIQDMGVVHNERVIELLSHNRPQIIIP